MDAHFFRLVSAELTRLLEGARLEKIHGPEPGVLVFTLYAGGRKRLLLFRHERQAPGLFFTGRRPVNPARPSAAVMRLRKYLGGRRLGPGISDYAARRMAFPVSGAPGQGGCWLMLDLAQGASVIHELPQGFGALPPWPGRQVADPLCATVWEKGAGEGPWREYAVLTPLLRESLAACSVPEGRALLVDLEAGGGDVFLYGDAARKPALYSAWPLPEAVKHKRGLSLLPLKTEGDEPVLLPWLAVADEAGALLEDYPALACACLVDEPKFLRRSELALRKQDAQPLRRASKKLERLFAKLDREEERLTAMRGLGDAARALQAELWRYQQDEKRAEVVIANADGEEQRRIGLDPLLTVRENMARMFKESTRGVRGLSMLEKRRADLRESSALPLPGVKSAGRGGDSSLEADAAPPGVRAVPDGGYKQHPGVARFLSSDGYTLLRGKNAKGNQSLLKIGAAHDLWLHAQDGPSAHLIIRRAHAAEEVPERTLLEAALLVAEKSRQRNDDKADIMLSALKHVHAVKGAGPGTVKVDAVMRTLRVAVPVRSDEE